MRGLGKEVLNKVHYQKIYEDKEFKYARVNDEINIKNEFKKRERKTRVSNHLQTMQTQMKHILNMNEGKKTNKVPLDGNEDRQVHTNTEGNICKKKK